MPRSTSDGGRALVEWVHFVPWPAVRAVMAIHGIKSEVRHVRAPLLLNFGESGFCHSQLLKHTPDNASWLCAGYDHSEIRGYFELRRNSKLREKYF
jgi:hypothetical protein